MPFSLRFPETDISYWADRNAVNKVVLSKLESIGEAARRQGYLKFAQFMRLCEVKSPRSRSHCKKNSPKDVKEVTSLAFRTKCERLRIECLTLLKGVAWPTASYILHFCSQDPYPILDSRALWSLSVEVPPAYNFKFWESYYTYCRNVANKNRVSLRTLDSALWRYSKENPAKLS